MTQSSHLINSLTELSLELLNTIRELNILTKNRVLYIPGIK